MATYRYPINVVVTPTGPTKDYPNASSPWIILVTTGTTQYDANQALSGSSYASSCFEITGVSHENRLVFESTASTCYVAVCAFRPGASYEFTSAYNCSRVYESGYTFQITANCVEKGETIVNTALTGNTAMTSHGVPYYKRINAGTVITSSNVGKRYLRKSNVDSSKFRVTDGIEGNRYVPLRFLGFNGEYFHSGAISARTASSYSLPVRLYVNGVSSTLGTVEVYVTDTPGGYGTYVQDSMQIWHGGYDISSYEDTLEAYTDSPTIYLGVHVDYGQGSTFIRVFADGTQVYGNTLYFDNVIPLASDTVWSTGFYTIYIGSN